jgi:hypothetical protein
MVKEEREEVEREMKIVKAKRWEIYKEKMKVYREEQARVNKMQRIKHYWVKQMRTLMVLQVIYDKFD